MSSPAEQLAAKKARKRAPRNKATPRNETWVCRVRDWREGMDLSLRDVAKAVGVSVTALHQIEHGTDPQLTTARKLSAFFRAPVEKLWPHLRAEA